MITLLLLLDTERFASEYCNRLVTNVLLVLSILPFIIVGVDEVMGAFGG